MPSVKITELPVLSQLSNNTANTLFVGVDRTTNTTSKFTTATLAAGLFANSAVNVGTSIVFSDSSTQSVAAAPANYTQSAFNVANTAANNILIIQGVNTAQNSYAYAVNQYAEGAYAKANNALANTSGTFNGNLNIAGGVTVNGTIVLANSNFLATESAITISASPSVATPSNDGYMIHISGKNGVPARIVTDSYGTGAYGLYAGRAARGTVISPTALQKYDIIARFSGNGYGTTKFQPLGVGRIDFVASENYTDSATGSQIQFWNCPVGSNTLTNIATFNGDSVDITGVINPQKGFIYTPRVLPGAQTAITINFANDSVVRAQTSTGLTVTLSNLLAGKEVVAWITNTAGTTQTFTHGCSALNSTVNATTYGIPSTSTILVRYMSIDATAQNTFVAITHA
jgi:hypothetical protein